MSLLKCLLPILSLFVISACSSADKADELGQVKSGMTKAEVLGIAGNPSRSGRVQGADKWSYDILDDEKRRVRIIDVYFTSGRVSFIGSEDEFESSLKKPTSHHDASSDSEFREL